MSELTFFQNLYEKHCRKVGEDAIHLEIYENLDKLYNHIRKTEAKTQEEYRIALSPNRIAICLPETDIKMADGCLEDGSFYKNSSPPFEKHRDALKKLIDNSYDPFEGEDEFFLTEWKLRKIYKVLLVGEKEYTEQYS